jgi:hypothetical protein
MKRLLVLTSLSLAAVFMVSSAAHGQGAPERASTQAVLSSTSPQRDRTLPATFTTTGSVVAPPYCTAGVTPSAGEICGPLICAAGSAGGPLCVADDGCPAGVTNPLYCVRPPAALLCVGNVVVTFRNGSSTVSSRTVDLQPDCTFRSRITFRSRTVRRATLRVSVRFEGNDLLLPKSAAVDTVHIG